MIKFLTISANSLAILLISIRLIMHLVRRRQAGQIETHQWTVDLLLAFEVLTRETGLIDLMPFDQLSTVRRVFCASIQSRALQWSLFGLRANLTFLTIARSYFTTSIVSSPPPAFMTILDDTISGLIRLALGVLLAGLGLLPFVLTHKLQVIQIDDMGANQTTCLDASSDLLSFYEPRGRFFRLLLLINSAVNFWLPIGMAAVTLRCQFVSSRTGMKSSSVAVAERVKRQWALDILLFLACTGWARLLILVGLFADPFTTTANETTTSQEVANALLGAWSLAYALASALLHSASSSSKRHTLVNQLRRWSGKRRGSSIIDDRSM